MRFQLIINNLDITPYIKEGGVDVSYVSRNERNLVTMDGVRHYVSREKLRLSISLLDRLYDSAYHDVANVLVNNPVDVSYFDFDSGQTVTGYFYVFDKKHKPLKTFANISLINDGGFTLEQK